MKPTPHHISRGLFFCLLAAALSSHAEETFQLQWQESGVTAKMGGYRPSSVATAAAAPGALKNLPKDLASPVYGSIKVGPAGKEATIAVVSDEKDGKPSRLLVNAKGDGDFANDAARDWTSKASKQPDGKELVYYFNEATIRIPFASGSRAALVKFYCLRSAKNRIQYYCDAGFTGEAKIDGKAIPVVVSGVTGDPKLAGPLAAQPLFWFDVNGDGKRGRGELVSGSRPFAVGDKWFAVSSFTADGAIAFAPAEKPETVAKAGPDLSPGKIAPSFTGTLSDGKTVKFPDDFKGKIVLLDFWATWCGPCVAEVPNVVKTYKTYHPQGFEILGISLDREGDGPKLAKFTSEHEMTWQQVFDGKFWQAAVAQLYGVNAIPQMVLVDGDTGKIIASENVRGEALAPAVEKAVKEKGAK